MDLLLNMVRLRMTTLLYLASATTVFLHSATCDFVPDHDVQHDRDPPREQVKLGCQPAPPMFGYPVEQCILPTEPPSDYYLTMFRIKSSPDCKRKPGGCFPAMLLPDIMRNSDSWVLSPNSLAFKLAAAGFEVFAANLRGTTYTKTRTRFTPEYYQYGFQELTMDFKVHFDFAQKITGSQAIHVTSFSSSTAIPFILATKFPEYCSRFAGLYMISPSLFNKNSTGYFEKFEAGLNGIYTDPPKFVKQRESEGRPMVCKDNFAMLPDLHVNCSDPRSDQCQSVAIDYWGGSRTSIDVSLWEKYMRNALNGASAKAMCTTMQWAKTGKLQDFDWGCPSRNKRYYGVPSPPQWNLKACPNVKLDVVTWSGDTYGKPEDVKRFSDEVSCDQDVSVVKDDNLGHGTFLFSKEISATCEKMVQEIAKDVAYFKMPNPPVSDHAQHPGESAKPM